jgi:3-hydroxyisobutyrate dehydrogenase-like beta-hydroxyacid dehydrogenase
VPRSKGRRRVYVSLPATRADTYSRNQLLPWLSGSLFSAAKDHGLTLVDCPAIGTKETAKRARLVLLASGPAGALDRAQSIFDAIGSKTVRLESEAGTASRMKLVAKAWTVALWESLRAQLSHAARRACSRRNAGRQR